MDVQKKIEKNNTKYLTMASEEEQHLLTISETSSTTTTTTSKRLRSANTKKTKKLKESVKLTKTTKALEEEQIANTNHNEELIQKQNKIEQEKATNTEELEKKSEKKLKSKKNKRSNEFDEQNISVKSGFSKFDAIQKKNLIHNDQSQNERSCRLCTKPVYKMEEIKAEKAIFHKNCFRCQECQKKLGVDNYQSHEGIVYCTIHFKSLFSPKCVEDTEPEKPCKPELIIRENQPAELPPNVVRASDKPNLGLEELHNLNMRQRFQVFENGPERMTNERNSDRNAFNNNNIASRRSIVLSKLAKIETHGPRTKFDDESSDDAKEKSELDDEENENNLNGFIGQNVSQNERERIVGLSEDAMQDIKSKFESGHIMSKEERREERKQEIQNIRSRLFMGKQAKIKEMYQQAVADSEHGLMSANKASEIDCDGAAMLLKERFETGEAFKCNENHHPSGIQNEADVFESGISKQSRSIFMELDANLSSKPWKTPINVDKQNKKDLQADQSKKIDVNNVIKCDEKVDDVKIETSEISEKFKFFETYRPKDETKKHFRITPPRDVTEVNEMLSEDEIDIENLDRDKKCLEKSHTTSKMLSKFRIMEQNMNKGPNKGPKPLKSFTPPPDGGRRLFLESESDGSSQDEIGNEDCDKDSKYLDDEALKEAMAAARAKQLRAKFEKWEANEINREKNEGLLSTLHQQIEDGDQIESTKSIRERFENLKYSSKECSTGPRYQINRFV